MPVGGGKGAREIEAGGAFVRLFTKNGDLYKGLEAARRRVAAIGQFFGKQGGMMLGFAGRQGMSAFEKIGKVLKGGALLGGAAAGGTLGLLGKALFGSMDHAKELQRLSDKLGVPSDKLGAFAFAAETTGEDLEALTGHFENFAERVKQGAEGAGEAASSFKRLGIDAKQMILKDPVDQMIMLSEAMQKVTNETERLGILSTFGGDQFQWLNTLFKNGPEGIRGLMQTGRDVGAVMDPARTRDLADAGRKLDTVWVSVKSAFLQVGAALLPTREEIEDVTEAIFRNLKSVREWITENKSAIRVVAAVAGGVAATAAAFLVFGPAIAAFTTAVAIPAQIAMAALAAGAGILATTLGVVGSVLGTAVGMIGTVIGGLMSAAGFFATIPGLITAGVLTLTGTAGKMVNVVDSLTTALGALPSALRGTIAALGAFGREAAAAFGVAFTGVGERFGRAMASIKEVAAETWGGVVSAVGRGDLAAAGEMAVTGLKLAWLKVKPEIMAVWESLRDGFGDAWTNIVDRIKTVWAEVSAAVMETVEHVKDLLSDIAAVLNFTQELRGKKVVQENSRVEGTTIADPFVGMPKDQPGIPISPEMKQRKLDAYKVGEEAVLRGMGQRAADLIVRGLVHGFDDAMGAEGKSHLEELNRRRAANVMADKPLKPIDVGLGAIGAKLEGLGNSFQESLRRAGGWANALNVVGLTKQLHGLVEAERRKVEQKAYEDYWKKHHLQAAQQLKAAAPQLPQVQQLAAVTKGLFQGPAAMQLGIGDKMMIELQKQTAKAGTATVKGIDKINENLVDIRDGIDDMGRLG